MSAKRGVALQKATQLAEATKVLGDVIPSSPFLRPMAIVATCKAAVPFDTAIA